MGLLGSFKIFKHVENNIAGHFPDQIDHSQKVVVDTQRTKTIKNDAIIKSRKNKKLYKKKLNSEQYLRDFIKSYVFIALGR